MCGVARVASGFAVQRVLISLVKQKPIQADIKLGSHLCKELANSNLLQKVTLDFSHSAPAKLCFSYNTDIFRPILSILLTRP